MDTEPFIRSDQGNPITPSFSIPNPSPITSVTKTWSGVVSSSSIPTTQNQAISDDPDDIEAIRTQFFALKVSEPLSRDLNFLCKKGTLFKDLNNAQQTQLLVTSISPSIPMTIGFAKIVSACWPLVEDNILKWLAVQKRHPHDAFKKALNESTWDRNMSMAFTALLERSIPDVWEKLATVVPSYQASKPVRPPKIKNPAPKDETKMVVKDTLKPTVSTIIPSTVTIEVLSDTPKVKVEKKYAQCNDADSWSFMSNNDIKVDDKLRLCKECTYIHLGECKSSKLIPKFISDPVRRLARFIAQNTQDTSNDVLMTQRLIEAAAPMAIPAAIYMPYKMLTCGGSYLVKKMLVVKTASLLGTLTGMVSLLSIQAFVSFVVLNRVANAYFNTPNHFTAGVAAFDEDNVADRVNDPESGKSEVATINVPEYVVEKESWLSWLTFRQPDFVDTTTKANYFVRATANMVAIPSTSSAEATFWNNHPEPTLTNYSLYVIQFEKWVRNISNLTPTAEHIARMNCPLAAWVHQRDEIRLKNPSVAEGHRVTLVPGAYLSVKRATYVLMPILALWIVYKNARRGTNRASALAIVIPEVLKHDHLKEKYPAKYWNVDQVMPYEQLNPFGKLLRWCFSAHNKLMSLFGFDVVESINSPLRENAIAHGIVPPPRPHMDTDGLISKLSTDCVISPILEESLRAKFGWRFTALISVVETAYNMNISTIPLHVTCQLLQLGLPQPLGYLCAVTVHFSWNVMVTFSEFFNQDVGVNTASMMKHWSKYKMLPPVHLEPPAVRLFKPSARIIRPFIDTVCKERNKQYNIGPGSNAYAPIYPPVTPESELTALQARVLKATPVPNAFVLGQFSQWFKANVWKILPKTRHRKGFAPPSFSDYIQRSNASPGVKRTLKEVRLKLTKDGIDEYTQLSAAEVAAFGVKSSFVKVENNTYRTPAGIKVKACRLIQGSKAEYLCLLGPYFQRLQDYIKRDLNKNNFMCFTSGVSTQHAAELLTSLNGVILENDVSAWDSSLDVEFADLETWLIEQMGAPIAIRQLMRANRFKRGKTQFGYKYSVLGTRASGEPFTSLFNSLWNMCIHLFIYCIMTGRTVQQCRGVIRGLFQGDDCAMNVPIGTNINWQMWFRLFGFDCKAIVRQSYTDVEFCSMRLYPVKTGWCFGPKIGKVLNKLGYFISPPLNVHPMVLLRGTCLGLYPAASFLRPLRIVLDSILSRTKEFEAHPTRREEWQMRFSSCESTEATDIAIEHHYDLTEYHLRELTCEVNVSLGDGSRKIMYEYLCDRDTGGPQLYLH